MSAARMSGDRFEVAVIGGGPAGCAAAIELARAGARVALIEAKTYPHDKLCGEFLSPECAPILNSLGVSADIRALNPVSIDRVRVTTPSGTAWRATLPAPALGLTRAALDAVLAQQAVALGATLCDRTAVKHVTGSLHEGFSLLCGRGGQETEIHARVVIGAYGKRASLDRSLNRQFLARRQPFVAFKAHFDGLHLPRLIELHGFPGGYCGMSNIEDGRANVCFLVHESALRAARAPGVDAGDAVFAWIQAANPYLREQLHGTQRVHPAWLSIAQIAFVDKEPLAGDILMTGDAAGLIVPLAGDGIGMALQGGVLAAEHAARYLSGRASAAALRQNYASAWRRRFGPQLRLGRMLQVLMLRPHLLSLGLRVLGASPALSRYVITRTRNLQPLSRAT